MSLSTRFSLRELMLFAVCLCVAAGWIAERRSLRRMILALSVDRERYEDRLAAIERVTPVNTDRHGALHLVYALTDPDRRISQEADHALRRLSGLQDGVGPFPPPDGRIGLHMARWLEWYESGLTPTATNSRTEHTPSDSVDPFGDQ